MELLRASDVSAVVVTRGGIDLTPIFESLPFDDVVVWDNSKRENDLKVYGRYAAIAEAANRVIYTQDDDCIMSGHDTLLREYRPGRLVVNMPHDHVAGGETYRDTALVGWGSLFDRSLPFAAFALYGARYPTHDGVFYRQCDLIFTTLTPYRRLDLGFEHLPHAYDEQAMYRQPGNYDERDMVIARARALRDTSPSVLRWGKRLAGSWRPVRRESRT